MDLAWSNRLMPLTARAAMEAEVSRTKMMSIANDDGADA
jgi:hypothetical protein